MDFLWWNYLVGLLCTIPCAWLGCFLVLRRMSMLGDAISHGVLPGIVLAVMFTGQITGWPIILGAMLFGILTAILTQVVHSVIDVPEDASMGVVFTSLFALGVLLISQLTFPVDLDTGCVLFGIFEIIPLRTISLLGMQVPQVMPTMVLVLLGTAGFLGFFWKELTITSFDPALATAMGFSALVMHLILMAMVAAVTVTAFEAVGSVLVIAMLIVPAATAHLLTDRLWPMLLWSTLVAGLSSTLGILFAGSNFLDTNASGMMAVMSGCFFFAAVFLAPRHGIAIRVIRNRSLNLRIVGEDILAALYRSEEAATHGDSDTERRHLQHAAQASRGINGWLVSRQLRRSGELEYSQSENRWKLTSVGRGHAQRVVRSHRLWEKYLDENFSLPLDHLHEPAERMEHFIDPELEDQLHRELAEPDTDPHGRTIPQSGISDLPSE